MVFDGGGRGPGPIEESQAGSLSCATRRWQPALGRRILIAVPATPFPGQMPTQPALGPAIDGFRNMNATHTTTQVVRVPGRLVPLATLARLLERLDHSREPVDADQYLAVVRRLQQLLQDTPADEALHAVLEAFPSAAQVYENLQYRHAGLCRSPLERSLRSELAARQVIERVSGGEPAGG